MKNEEKFFKGIADTLHAYEDAYVPGAWEGFQQKRRRRRTGLLFLRIGSAAAILQVLSYVAFLFLAKSPDVLQYAQSKKSVQPPKNHQLSPKVQHSAVQSGEADSPALINQQPPVAKINKAIQQNKAIVTESKTVNVPDPIIATAKQIPPSNNQIIVKAPVVKPDSAVLASNKLPVKNNVITSAQNPVTQQNPAATTPPEVVPDKVIANNVIQKRTRSARSVYDSLMESKINKPVARASGKNKERNLTYGIVVQPAVGNQKFNFGTGVQLSYKVTDRISINSGIAYSSLNATSSGSAMSTRQGNVQRVDLAVSGFEVPVGVQYKTEKGFYVSAGVMGMSVVNNHLEYNYVAQNAVATTMLDKQGAAYSAISVVAENKTEESKEKVANYLGFYILSVGKKKAIGKKNNINFGPFLRVPFGAVSSEKIRLLQGGVSLGLDF